MGKEEPIKQEQPKCRFCLGSGETGTDSYEEGVDENLQIIQIHTFKVTKCSQCNGSGRQG